MDQKQPAPTFDESVNQVMQTLPSVIRAYLVQGKHTAVAKNLMMKYGLRIDQAGVLEQEIILLIMGVDNPDEFTQVLVKEAKLNQQTISDIVQDVNAQIFVPLRQEMMKSGTVTAPQPPRPQIPTPRPMATPSATEPPRYFHLENKLPLAPRAIPEVRPSPAIPKVEPQIPQPAPFPQPPRPSLAPSIGEPRPAPAQVPFVAKQIPSAPTQPSVNIFNAGPKVVPQQPPPMPVRPPISNIAPLPPKIVLPRPMLPIGEQPSALRPMNIPHRSAAETPLQQALRTVLPPANLPGAMPPADIVSEVRPSPTIPKVEPQSSPTPKTYSADPYREPVE